MWEPLILSLYLSYSFHTRNDYQVGYRIKIKLICRLSKDWDKALISVSTIQECQPQIDKIWSDNC